MEVLAKMMEVGPRLTAVMFRVHAGGTGPGAGTVFDSIMEAFDMLVRVAKEEEIAMRTHTPRQSTEPRSFRFTPASMQNDSSLGSRVMPRELSGQHAPPHPLARLRDAAMRCMHALARNPGYMHLFHDRVQDELELLAGAFGGL